jgi:Ca-activated chloride channel homolog
MRKHLLPCVIGLVLFFPAIAGAAQVDSSARSNAVSVPFFAEDSRGQHIDHIALDGLSILDNKKPPQAVVALRSPHELPLRLGVLIDTSGSQKKSPLYVPGIQALDGFIYEVLSGPEDRVFVVSFSDVPNGSGLMGRDEFQSYHLDLNIKGGTALWDSVVLACRERMEESAGGVRRVLVVVSDGEDNSSHATEEKAIDAAQEAGTVAFSVSTGEESNALRANRNLKDFGDRTGGYAFVHLNKQDLPGAFSEIKARIENMYVVTYVPADLGQPGKRHSLEIALASDRKVKLRAPKDYYVTPPAK